MEFRCGRINTRGISTEIRVLELEHEAASNGEGILHLQENWRKEETERLDIGSWVFYGSGKKDSPMGTEIIIHKSLEVETWYHVDPRITAIRVPYGDRHLFIVSAYAPVQQGRHNSQRTDRFYEKLGQNTAEAGAKGDLVIVGGDMNTSITQENAPNLIGKWSSAKEGENSGSLISFMVEQKLAAASTFQQT
jgi:exonuclease III